MIKRIYFLGLFLVLNNLLSAQIPNYYNDANLGLSGQALKNELSSLIISTHVNYLSYSDIWYSSKITDEDPNNSSNVLLVYGYDDIDGNYMTDRTRSKGLNGGNVGRWNREHSYPKSKGTPNLGTSGPGADAHHLRPSDSVFNSHRGSRKFTNGSGDAGEVSSYWYPGDEWKGDVARMMMYMYLRYGDRCKPTNVGTGSSSSTSDYMIDLFLEWNAEDPVSQFEINRNEYHGNISNSYAQGNRNPFIDNPAFATEIWGGPQAEDKFGTGGGGTGTSCSSTISSFPYVQGFENTLGVWTQDQSNDDNDWSLRANGTPSSGTGPSSAVQGSYYVYVEASVVGTGYPNKRSILNSPCFDLSSESEAVFSFKYSMKGASNMGSIVLEASTDDGDTWTSIWNESGSQGSAWLSASVDLNSYVGETVQLRFNRLTGSTWKADVAIDDISLSTKGTGGGGNDNCAADYLELLITFDNYPEETGWNVKDANGAIIASNSYSTSNADGSTIQENFSLNSGNYTFTITDEYGDGICCTYGDGLYVLSSSSGDIVSGSSFTSSESTAFCVNSTTLFGSRKADSIESELVIYPNPVSSILHIDSDESIKDVIIYSALGTPVRGVIRRGESVDVSDLARGTYFIRVVSEDEVVTRSFIKE